MHCIHTYPIVIQSVQDSVLLKPDKIKWSISTKNEMQCSFRTILYPVARLFFHILLWTVLHVNMDIFNRRLLNQLSKI